MKVLFLDIDGVLWLYEPEKQKKQWDDFSSVAVGNLNYITLCEPEVRIVISSAWRHGHSLSWLRDHFASNGFVSPEIMIDVTPDLPYDKNGNERGKEIQAWLDQHPEVSKFVILDDDSDMAHLMPYLVQTEFCDGLTKAKAEMVLDGFKDNSDA